MVIYIIEDDPGVSDSLRFLLQAMGHAVSAYDDAETFLVEAEPQPQDVLIIDLGLPGMSGAEAIREVTGRGWSPRIICITGQAQKTIDESLRDMPSTQVLRKPLSGETIVALL
ncbi:response regulator [Prosthecodimorpha staleyi]|uniref:Response regulator n=1 Tax=Prosthecodimorpha staleyi TaxID=2840188 RepID=A0A947GD08_9HYPH|nr:response regulator [Prosthecodimorpha staleyi]MBT9292008.1 response regulator [Prosthecodimorpha staleyi]